MAPNGDLVMLNHETLAGNAGGNVVTERATAIPRRRLKGLAIGAGVVLGLLCCRTVGAQPLKRDRAPSIAKGQEHKPQRTVDESEYLIPAIEGYCPVAYRHSPIPVRGNPAFSSTYGGQRYYFTGADAKKQFDSDPKRFAPQFGGLCSTALGGSYLKRMPSDPKVFALHHDKLYLFSSERAKRAFVKNPEYFIARAESVFIRPALDGYCPVSYRTQSKAVKGTSNARTLYRGYYYYCANPQAMAAFRKNPEKYVPRYEGLCAEGVSRGKSFPGVPEIFAVYGNATYLFYDAQAKEKFLADPAAMIRAADGHWKKIRESRRSPLTGRH